MTALVAFQELEQQLKQSDRTHKIAEALTHAAFNVDYFKRVFLTLILRTPKLLEADRSSLLVEMLKCAEDGLKPDGREAAFVVFKGKVVYIPMIAGIRRLIQQSGEISRFEQTIVYENDEFYYRLGDHPQIHHVPTLGERGEPINVYSIAQFRSDGTLSREVMTRAQIEQIRAMAPGRNGEAWSHHWEEMARKTVARRHAKILPSGSDNITRVFERNDDKEFESEQGSPPVFVPPPERRPRLADQLNNLGHASDKSNVKRGRPRKTKTADRQYDTLEEYAMDHEPPIVGMGDEPLPPPDDNDQWPGPDVKPIDPDFLTGKRDAEAGRVDCLNKDISGNPKRYRQWQNGFNSVGKQERRS